MGRKKKKRPQEEELIWCYYCDRIFRDEATLITHQKAKHYRCSACNKKMNTAQGLQVHCDQVHKINVDRVPGAKAGRDSMDIEIFGMAGVPDDMRPGGVFEEPQHSAKKVATEANMAGARVETIPSSIPQAGGLSYAIPPQVSMHMGVYPQHQIGMYYGMPPGPPIYHNPQSLASQIQMLPQGQLPPGAPYRPPGIPPPIPPPGIPPRGIPGLIQAPPIPRLPGAPPPIPIQAAAPPPGAALFPIAPAPAVSQPTPKIQPPEAVAPAQSAAVTSELDLLWKDEEYSMEEKRAELMSQNKQAGMATKDKW